MNTENTASRVLKIIAGGPSFAIQSTRQALEDAARSLETIAELAGRDETLLEPDQVRGYAASRAYMARVALATPGQPQPASAEAIPAEQAAPTESRSADLTDDQIDGILHANGWNHGVNDRRKAQIRNSFRRTLNDAARCAAQPHEAADRSAEAAYWQGWCEAADWAKRDDLYADRDSDAYEKAMRRRLAAMGTPAAAEPGKGQP